MFSDMPPTPSDPVRQLKIGGIPWTTRQAVLSLSAYAYQKAISVVLAKERGLSRPLGMFEYRNSSACHRLAGLTERARDHERRPCQRDWLMFGATPLLMNSPANFP